jgi:hypothetical protein
VSALDSLWHRFRLEIVALAEGPTASLEGSISHGKSSTKAPPRAGADLRHFDREWRNAKTDEARRRVILCEDCAPEGVQPTAYKNCCVVGLLRAYKLAKPHTRRGTKDWREGMARDVRPLRTVARAYGVRDKTVQSARAEFETTRKPGRRTVTER